MRLFWPPCREFVAVAFFSKTGFRSRIKAADADYFSLSPPWRSSGPRGPPPAPSINQAKRALPSCPTPHRSKSATKQSLPYCAHGGSCCGFWYRSTRCKHVLIWQEQSVTQNPRESGYQFGKVHRHLLCKGFAEAEIALGDWWPIATEVAALRPRWSFVPAQTAIAAKIKFGILRQAVFTRSHWKKHRTCPQDRSRRVLNAAGVPNTARNAFRHMLARPCSQNATSVLNCGSIAKQLGTLMFWLLAQPNGSKLSRDDQTQAGYWAKRWWRLKTGHPRRRRECGNKCGNVLQ